MAYTFIKARWFTPTGGRRIDLVVLHTAETPEGVNTARAVANYFATTTVRASAHYTVDPKNIFQCVKDKDVAYAAPGANSNGIHLELSGRAAQTAGEWHDTYSTALLAKAATLTADICAAYKIPARYVPAAQLAAGGAAARGITTHNEVSKAFRKSTHWDPGPNFPIIEFVNAVLGGSPPAPPTKEALMAQIPNASGYCFLPNADLVITSTDGALYFFDADGVADDREWVDAYNVHPDWWGGSSPTTHRKCIGVAVAPDADFVTQVFDDGSTYQVRAKK